MLWKSHELRLRMSVRRVQAWSSTLEDSEDRDEGGDGSDAENLTGPELDVANVHIALGKYDAAINTLNLTQLI